MDVMFFRLGDEWEMGCPKNPNVWESECEVWSENESVSSSCSREGTVCKEALHVTGVVWVGVTYLGQVPLRPIFFST